MAKAWVVQRVQETEGILLILVSMLVFLSLWSYSPLDPSFNSSGLGPDFGVRNWIGVVGSHTSDLLLQLLGDSAFVIPLLLLAAGIRLAVHRPITGVSLRLLGVLLLLPALSAAIRILWPGRFYENLPAGGLIGERAGTFLLSRLGVAGALLTCAAVLLVAVLLMTQLLLFQLLGRAWNLTREACERVHGALGARWKSKKQERERARMRQEMLDKHRSAVRQPTPAPEELPASAPPPVEPAAEPARPRAPVARKAAPSKSHLQEVLDFGERGSSEFPTPPLDLLDNPPRTDGLDTKELTAKARLIESKFAEFGIDGVVCDMHPGPVITVYEYQPSPGVKFSRIQSMADDLSLALKVECVRIDKVPGRSTIGLEVPNSKREMIYLREILQSMPFRSSPSLLTLALGKDATGEPFVADLARMPHLLIAGATGMGKSVFLHSIICALLYKGSPEDVRLILIDPKRVELGVYADIPHLYCEVIIEPRKAVIALKNAKSEMDKRYRTLVRYSSRNLEQYNARIRRREYTLAPGEEPPAILPYLVIVIDELADLMAEMSGEVEHQIGRLAQMARAVGIHLILATQRPSVDIITGTIKNNLPARISFRVTQKIDSRTILDAPGADQLLGNGDMLFMAPGTSRLTRVHGAFVSEEEVSRVVTQLRKEGKPDYNNAFLADPDREESGMGGDVQDEMFVQAVELVLSSGQASASHLQRRLKLGYNRAARLVDMMEERGIVGPSTGPNKSRDILVKPDYLDTLKAGGPPED